MIPDVNRKEWKDLIQGRISHKCSSFSLQMKINSLNMSYRTNHMSLDEAVRDLHSMCWKYEKMYQKDIEQIFNLKTA